MKTSIFTDYKNFTTDYTSPTMPPKRPPLMAAVGAGRLDDAMAILAADPPPTRDVIAERDLNGWSALTHATRVGTHELVCAVPECKRVCERVRVGAPRTNPNPPPLPAASQCDQHCQCPAIYLVLHNLILYWRPCSSSSLQVLALVAANADVHDLTVKRETPLHWAARAGNVDVLKTLLGLGADPEAVSAKGWRPLLWAAQFGPCSL
jgi:ankyrin repeat protein